MIRRLFAAGLLAPLLGMAPSAASSDTEDLVRSSCAAYRRGDLAAAAALLERAQRLAPDPRLVAFNLATVRFHQARAGQTAALAEAELYFRCCLEPGDGRRAEALLGLGNCLLLRGSSARPDAAALRAAIDRFTLCLREPGCPPEVARAARWNQARARLLLLQAAPPAESIDEQPGGDNPNPEPPEDRTRPTAADPRPGGPDGAEPDRKDRAAPDAEGNLTDEANRREAAGGAPTTLSDQADAPPISAPDAAAHLEAALDRISADWLRHRHSRARPVSPGVRDW